MLPQLHLPLGSVHAVVSTHGVFVVVGVVLGIAVATRGRHVPGGVVLLTVAAVAVCGLFGARALYVLQRGGPLDGRAGGMASFGGIALGLAVTAALARVTLVRTAHLLDAIAPAFLIAFGCGRLGCFFNGCCAGAATGLPWAMVFPELGPAPRHPLQLYSAALDFALAGWAMTRPAPPGVVAVRCAVGLGLGRCLLEALRDPSATDVAGVAWLTVPQLCGLALAAAAWSVGRRLADKPELAFPS